MAEATKTDFSELNVYQKLCETKSTIYSKK